MFGLIPWKSKERNGGTALVRAEESPFAVFRKEFDNLFDRFFAGWPAVFGDGGQLGRFWGMDLDDTGKEVVVRAEAPGFEANDFDVQVSGNLLTIRAERKAEERKGGGSYHESRRFLRSLTLPAGTDCNQVEARYRNGVLELRFPKTPEAQGKRIEVKT
jgi:HSP20 family protein